jgi:DNA-binding NarL/FixJ family response regulator
MRAAAGLTVPLRVEIIAADPLVHAGLSALLAGDAGLQLDGDPPEVALWDLGAEKATAPEEFEVKAPVLALVRGPQQVLAAIAAGASGVLQRDAGAEAIAAR